MNEYISILLRRRGAQLCVSTAFVANIYGKSVINFGITNATTVDKRTTIQPFRKFMDYPAETRYRENF